MAFSAELLQGELHTGRFGRACRVVAEAASTVDLAWEWLREGGPEGGAVIAERQTRGRGRLGRHWASPDGGLWMSVIACPEMPVARGELLGVGMALAAADAAAQVTGGAAEAEWPNDIVMGGRKVGGVLAETAVSGATITAAVLSLGLNVNVSMEDLPREVQESAISLREAAGGDYALETVAARVLEGLERLWPAIIGGDLDLPEGWREREARAAGR